MASPQDVPDFDNFELSNQTARGNYATRKPRSQQGDLNDEWYEQRHRRGAWGNPRRITAREFILRYPMIEDDSDADKEWGPVRLLGKGGFGLVGLWEKRDGDNKAVDRVAIKQAKILDDKGLYLSESPPLLKEAVVHHDLNTKNADAFPWLRRYKYQPVQSALATRFRVPDAQRMYLEFCEHGDLDGLRSKYRLWDQHLPELFLWRLFYQLAVAGDALREPPPPNSRVLQHILKHRDGADKRHQDIVDARQERQRLNKTTPEGVRLKEAEKLDQIQLVTEQSHYDQSAEKRQYPFQHYSTVHFDMKPSNVLLADTNWQGKRSPQHHQQQQEAVEGDDDSDQGESQEPPETQPAKRRRTGRKTVNDKEQPDRGDLDNPDYPLAKMSDFGLAQYTTYLHRANPGTFWRFGTEAFLGPEQIGYGAHWNLPPTGALIRSLRWGANGQPEAVDPTTAYHNQVHDGQRDIVFDHSLNIYGIGRTMYGMATLADDCELHGDEGQLYADRRALDELQYKACYHHQIRRVGTKIPKTYSPRLRHLIWRCIDPNPANRPSQFELHDRTKRGLDMFVEKCKRQDDEALTEPDQAQVKPRPSQKLFYRGTEINNMPRGQANFELRWDHLRDAFREEFLNPDVARLHIPQAKFERLRPPHPGDAEAFNRELVGQGLLWRQWNSVQPSVDKWFNDGNDQEN